MFNECGAKPSERARAFGYWVKCQVKLGARRTINMRYVKRHGTGKIGKDRGEEAPVMDVIKDIELGNFRGTESEMHSRKARSPELNVLDRGRRNLPKEKVKVTGNEFKTGDCLRLVSQTRCFR